VRYGGRACVDGGFGLHACRLGFFHPVSGDRLVFEALPPDTRVWQLYRNALSSEIPVW
jgi:hypothetical protein